MCETQLPHIQQSSSRTSKVMSILNSCVRVGILRFQVGRTKAIRKLFLKRNGYPAGMVCISRADIRLSLVQWQSPYVPVKRYLPSTRTSLQSVSVLITVLIKISGNSRQALPSNSPSICNTNSNHPPPQKAYIHSITIHVELTHSLTSINLARA